MKPSIAQDTNLVGTTMSSFLTVPGLLRISAIQKRSKRFCQEDLSVGILQVTSMTALSPFLKGNDNPGGSLGKPSNRMRNTG